MADIQQPLFFLDCFMSEDEGTAILQTLATAILATTLASQKT
jgi:response regulator of citrate/malate metabolism